MEDSLKQKKVEWIDIYKGILMITVVIGHSTGFFNGYIYQFHMAAFFFISGYLANLDKDGFIKTIYKKICTYLLPLTTVFILLLFVMEIMSRLGIYQMLLSDMPYVGMKTALLEYFTGSSIYVWWLGAAWFVIALFKIVILQKALYIGCGKRANGLYLGMSIALYFLGSYIATHLTVLRWLDLALIGQFYYVLGFIFKKKDVFSKIENKRVGIYALMTLNIALMIFFQKKGITVDYPSRAFKQPITELLAAANGIILVFVVSKVLEKVNITKKLLSYIGINTMPVLFFHFLYFNVTFYLLYLAGQVPFEYIGNFLFTEEIGIKYWWLNTIISISLSLLTWVILLRSRTLSALLGNDKKLYDGIYKKICDIKIIKKVGIGYLRICDAIKKKLAECRECILKYKFLKIGCALLIVLILIPCTKGVHDLLSVGSDLATCKWIDGHYADGWMTKETSFQILTGEKGVISIVLVDYHDDGQKKVVDIYINDELKQTEDIQFGENQIEFSATVNSVVTCTLKTNYSFQPEGGDLRELSYVVSQIEAR